MSAKDKISVTIAIFYLFLAVVLNMLLVVLISLGGGLHSGQVFQTNIASQGGLFMHYISIFALSLLACMFKSGIEYQKKARI